MKKILFGFTLILFCSISVAQKTQSLLSRFQQYITGDFDNSAQVVAEIKMGKQIHPLSIHVNRWANKKVKNLPTNLKGFFIIEESYYLIDGKSVDVKPYLFLFEEKDGGVIHLTTYQLTGITKESIRNDNSTLEFDYNTLMPSPSFKGANYTWDATDKTFNTVSPNELSNGMKFTLTEKLAKNQLHVLEQVEKDGKLLTAWNTPIIYIRTSSGKL